METLPYRDLRVLDVTDVWAGPMAATFLGDLGAHVIRVESYPRPSILRPIVGIPGAPGFIDNDPLKAPSWERSVRYYTANRNKRGIAVDLKDGRGRAIVERLVRDADVFLESYASGVIEKLGLGWKALRALNPGVIMVSMSGWGSGGPYHGYRTMGSGIDASTGHPYLRGYADTDVSATVQAYQSDAAAASAALFAVGVALWRRRRTGLGTWVDLSQAEVLMAHMPAPFLAASFGLPPAPPLENGHPFHAPYGCYPCAGNDRWIQICVRDQNEWRALCSVLDAALLADERFQTPVARRQHRQKLDEQVRERTAIWTNTELMEALQRAGVAAGAVYRNEQIAQDRQLNARTFFQTRDHPIAGPRVYPGYAWRFDGGDIPLARTTNTLGEHNEEVLRELGYTDAAVAALYHDQVIGNTFAPAVGSE